MKKVFLSAGALLVAATAALPAKTVYIPSPSVGTAQNPKVLVEVAKTATGPQTLNVGFIPSGQSGLNASQTSRNVNNYFRPNVFEATRFVDETGMLKITDQPGIETVVAALSLEKGSEDTHWRLPIISESNWYNVGETAFLENLERTPRGVSNVEIMNFGDVPANCQVVLKRPRGTEIGTPLTVVVPALSSRVAADVLKGRIAVASATSVKSEVRCDQPFYAYGTFVDADPLGYRLIYPLDLPTTPYTETVTYNRPGNFFTPVAGNSELVIDLPLVRDRSYRRAEIEFDLTIGKFSPVFNAIMGFFHPGGPRFGKTLYYAFNVRGLRGRTLIDLGTPAIESAPKRNTAWKEGEAYHVRIVYDAEMAITTFTVRKKGGGLVVYAQSGAFNLDLADRGNPVRLSFGLRSVADNAYFPPIGWRYSNLEVKVQR